MFTKRTETKSMLDAEIHVVLDKMKDLDKNTEEYGKLLEHVSKLSKLKAEESPQRISPDNVLLVAANVFGILAIIHHEHAHAITSKAIGFVMKPR